MASPRIGVIMATTRGARIAEKPAKWLMGLAAQRNDLEFELIDLRDYPLPFYDEDYPPAYGPLTSEVGRKWQAKVAEFDGYIFVTGEYNNSIPAVFKNALDYAYSQWNRKPVAFFGYGGVGGVRAVQHLRHVVIELQMAPLRHGIYLGSADFFALMQGQKTMDDFGHLEQSAGDLFDHLAWWANALKRAGEDG